MCSGGVSAVLFVAVVWCWQSALLCVQLARLVVIKAELQATLCSGMHIA